MQYDMKNVFTFVVFCNTLIDISFSAVDCPWDNEDETITKFISPRKILKVVNLRTIILCL